eukprot:NODE_362_length_8790_cov_0.566678.p9 type:complete len:169 gc:universal NODE_362_length_8790_cov_0.566678:7397-6891(-)
MTLFKNTHKLQTAFLKIYPKSELIRLFSSKVYLSEEGRFSRTIFTSKDISILLVPLTSNESNCKRIKMENQILICLDAKMVKYQKEPIQLHSSNKTQPISTKIDRKCDMKWLPLAYRTCVHDFKFGFISIKNQVAELFQVSEETRVHITRYPLLFQFKNSKNDFKLSQ